MKKINFILIIITLFFISKLQYSSEIILNPVDTITQPPIMIAPPNGATDVILTPLLDWINPPNATQSRLQLGIDSAFNTTIIDTVIISGYAVPAGKLTNNALYFWRVRGQNSGGYGPWSGTWHFTTLPALPGSPILLSPLNNSQIQSLTPLFDWMDVTGASGYVIQISFHSNFDSLILNATVSISQYQLGSGILQNDTGYYWRVKALNPSGAGPWSAVWHFSIHITAITKNDNKIPQSFELYPNYPNPFNPITKIKFDVANLNPPFTKGGQGGLTSLKIYDILGREVATLVNEKLQPGTYEVDWNASNYPSGVYFYKLEVRDAETSSALYCNVTKKFILLK